MNNIPQNDKYCNFDIQLEKLFQLLGINSLLRLSGFRKREKYGATVYDLFRMLFKSCFFHNVKTVHGNYTSSKQANVETNKSTFYNFLSSEYNNWRKLQLLLAQRAVDFFSKLNDADRKTCFVLDDTVLERAKGMHVELVSKVFDHVTNTFVRGFTALQLGWTDGINFLPLANALLSSTNEENRYVEATTKIDKRTSGSKRREESKQKKTTVAINLLKQALSMGITADYVLMDSWFTTEPFIREIRALGLDVIGMVKALKQRYEYKGELYNLRKLYQAIPNKRKGDVICSAVVKTKGGIEVKIIFIRNRNVKREYLAILSTDINIDEQEMVRHYAKRWFIETNFKAQKQYFRLGKETQGRDYDNLFAFVSISSIRYIVMEYNRRLNEDQRSLGQLFRDSCEQMADIPYITAIDTLMQCFKNLAKDLDDAHLLKKGCREKAQQLIEDKLSSWFTGICDYLQRVFSTLILT